MGIKDWNYKRSQSFTFGRSSSSNRRQRQSQQCIRLGQRFDQDDQNQIQRSRWKMLWRKIKREKQRIFNSSNNLNHGSGSVMAAYDPEGYSRNFDEGLECREPEYLTRSFSARFADPSKIIHKNRLFQYFKSKVYGNSLSVHTGVRLRSIDAPDHALETGLH